LKETDFSYDVTLLRWWS